LTNAKKAKQQRAEGVRKPPSRKQPQRGRSRALWYGLGVVVVVLVAIAVISSGGSSNGTPSADGQVSIDRQSTEPLQPGEAVPNFSAPSLDGSGTVTWSDYVGKPTVLAIWAPWCPHCQVELPRLSDGVDARGQLQMVTIATAIGREAGPSPQQYMSDKGLTFPVAVDDANATLMAGMGVRGFPTTYYVDSQGNVVTSTEGEVDPAQLNQILDDLATR
jgi:peroxiredoxin